MKTSWGYYSSKEGVVGRGGPRASYNSYNCYPAGIHYRYTASQHIRRKLLASLRDKDGCDLPRRPSSQHIAATTKVQQSCAYRGGVGFVASLVLYTDRVIVVV